ncbi:LacI family transcriptional regulator [uncultured Cohaesibacter sp.]|uniref:LacI family transcriptional regulator n=1 Tax=uncultured Cohaesibacter sp. TaxID=1002546 RepID=UPI0029C95BBA|nr:LacI family transcriptional regulator [uncultured Cohaesibacter sp.]
MSAQKIQHKSTTKPTLKTISQISGLAVATVSRALNDAPDLRQETKDLVRRIANEIGYVPNRAGLGLRTGKTNVISLIISTENDMMHYTHQLMSAVATRLRGTPYHLTITPFFPDQNKLDPVRYVVETGSADAIVLNRTEKNDPRVDYLIEKGFPFATHGRTFHTKQHAYYDFDNEVFARLMVRKMHERGCKKILLVAPPLEETYAQHMRNGALAAAEELGIEVMVESLVHCDEPSKNVYKGIKERFSLNPEIDGLFTPSPVATMSAIAAIEYMGRTVGKDIQIGSKEPFRYLKLFRKDIIVLYEDLHLAGEFLTEAVLRQLRDPSLSPMQKVVVPDYSEF